MISLDILVDSHRVWCDWCVGWQAFNASSAYFWSIMSSPKSIINAQMSQINAACSFAIFFECKLILQTIFWRVIKNYCEYLARHIPRIRNDSDLNRIFSEYMRNNHQQHTLCHTFSLSSLSISLNVCDAMTSPLAFLNSTRMR